MPFIFAILTMWGIILVDVYCFWGCTGEEKEACYYWMNIKNT